MLLRYMDKIFALQPRANAIEYGVIVAIIGTAVLAILLAYAEPIAAAWQSIISSTPSSPIN
jgi:Flp/Fap pilin component.